MLCDDTYIVIKAKSMECESTDYIMLVCMVPGYGVQQQSPCNAHATIPMWIPVNLFDFHWQKCCEICRCTVELTLPQAKIGELPCLNHQTNYPNLITWYADVTPIPVKQILNHKFRGHLIDLATQLKCLELCGLHCTTCCFEGFSISIEIRLFRKVSHKHMDRGFEYTLSAYRV